MQPSDEPTAHFALNRLAQNTQESGSPGLLQSKIGTEKHYIAPTYKQTLGKSIGKFSQSKTTTLPNLNQSSPGSPNTYQVNKDGTVTFAELVKSTGLSRHIENSPFSAEKTHKTPSKHEKPLLRGESREILMSLTKGGGDPSMSQVKLDSVSVSDIKTAPNVKFSIGKDESVSGTGIVKSIHVSRQQFRRRPTNEKLHFLSRKSDAGSSPHIHQSPKPQLYSERGDPPSFSIGNMKQMFLKTLDAGEIQKSLTNRSPDYRKIQPKVQSQVKPKPKAPQASADSGNADLNPVLSLFTSMGFNMSQTLSGGVKSPNNQTSIHEEDSRDCSIAEVDLSKAALAGRLQDGEKSPSMHSFKAEATNGSRKNSLGVGVKEWQTNPPANEEGPTVTKQTPWVMPKYLQNYLLMELRKDPKLVQGPKQLRRRDFGKAIQERIRQNKDLRWFKYLIKYPHSVIENFRMQKNIIRDQLLVLEDKLQTLRRFLANEPLRKFVLLC